MSWLDDLGPFGWTVLIGAIVGTIVGAIVGFGNGGLGGALLGIILGFLLGGLSGIAFYVISPAVIGVAIIGGLIWLITFVISSLWGVGI